MGLREEIEKKIDRKEQEIWDLERDHLIQMAAARSYLQALQDMLKTIPRDAADMTAPRTLLRAGSSMAKARDAILGAGKALHITELLRAIGRPDDHPNRVSVSGSLATYVRKGQIFTRPAPNTFGLIELGHQADRSSAIEPPDGFGSVRATAASLTNLDEKEEEEEGEEEEEDERDEPEFDDDVPF
jgi:hypothetical protein